MTKLMAVLKRAREYELEVTALLEHIERLHRIGATAGKSSAYAQEIIGKLARLEAELNAQIDKTVDARREALYYISILHGEERAVIERYYILAQSWEVIAEKMYMSERRVYLLRKSALHRIEAAMPKEVIWASDNGSKSCGSAQA